MFVPDEVNGECWREETGRGRRRTWGREMLGFGWFDCFSVRESLFGELVYYLIIYIYSMVYIGGHRSVWWVVRVSLALLI